MGPGSATAWGMQSGAGEGVRKLQPSGLPRAMASSDAAAGFWC